MSAEGESVGTRRGKKSPVLVFRRNDSTRRQTVATEPPEDLTRQLTELVLEMQRFCAEKPNLAQPFLDGIRSLIQGLMEGMRD